MRLKLDARTVAALKLDDNKTEECFWDLTLPGFAHRLRRSHDRTQVLRSWVVQYKRAGATRRMTLGSAQVLTVEAARTMARKLLGKVATGEDPAADRRDRRSKDKVSFRSQVDEYLAIRRGEIRPKTLSEITRYLSG